MIVQSAVYVLDSFALLAYFQDEPAADAVERLLVQARQGEIYLAVAAVNLGEVVYRTIRARGHTRASEVLVAFSDYQIEAMDVDWDLALAGAEIKGTYRMSYADCIAAALARRLDATLVTGDPEFRQVEGLVAIEWLPRAVS